MVHWLHTLHKLCVGQNKRPALKCVSSRHHASRAVKVSLKVSMKWYVFDLTNVSFRLLMRMSRIHLLNATQRFSKNACRCCCCCHIRNEGAVAAFVLPASGLANSKSVLLVVGELSCPFTTGKATSSLRGFLHIFLRRTSTSL